MCRCITDCDTMVLVKVSTPSAPRESISAFATILSISARSARVFELASRTVSTWRLGTTRQCPGKSGARSRMTEVAWVRVISSWPPAIVAQKGQSMSESVGRASNALRRALWQLTTGLYILSLGAEERFHLMTISQVMQVATEPKVVAVAVESKSVSLEMLRTGAQAGLVILPKEAKSLAVRFAKPHPVTQRQGTLALNGVEVLNLSGLLVPKEALGLIRLRHLSTVEFASHALLLLEVVGVDEVVPVGSWGPTLSMLDTRMHYGG